MSRQRTAIVAGAGIFGLTSALELRRRGWEVLLLDLHPTPAPDAASTDLSKVIRREYGSDRATMDLASAALEGWYRWNRGWPSPLYHETGLLALSRGPLVAGGFAHTSFTSLLAAGMGPERLSGAAITRRFPAWGPGAFQDGFFHALAGWAESGRVVAALHADAVGAGVRPLWGEGLAELLLGDDRVEGVRTTAGRELPGSDVVVAAGAWTGHLLGLDWGLRATGHPVFHLTPSHPELFAPERFPVFMADIAETGWYGFPLHPRGVVKIARHAAGRVIHPDQPRQVTPGDEANLRAFLASALPTLADAPIVNRRLCLYSDTADGHFWIDRDPDRPGLVVASGGSGHGFKFAPLLGGWIADLVEGHPPPDPRFAWRTGPAPFAGEEEARAERKAARR